MRKILIILVSFFAFYNTQNSFVFASNAEDAEYQAFMQELEKIYNETLEKLKKECEQRGGTIENDECTVASKKEVRQNARREKKENRKNEKEQKKEDKDKEKNCKKDNTKKWDKDNQTCIPKTEEDICTEKGKSYKWDGTQCTNEKQNAKQSKKENKDNENKKSDKQQNRKDKKSCEENDDMTWTGTDCKTKEEVCNEDESKIWQDGKCINKKRAEKKEAAAANRAQKQAEKQTEKEAKKNAKEQKSCEKDPNNIWTEDGCITKRAACAKDTSKVWSNGECITKQEACEKDNSKVWSNGECVTKQSTMKETQTPVKESNPVSTNNSNNPSQPKAKDEDETTNSIKLIDQDTWLDAITGSYARHLDNTFCTTITNKEWTQSKSSCPQYLGAGQYSVVFPYGTIIGSSKCILSKTIKNFSECLCKLNSFTPKNGNKQTLNYDWYPVPTKQIQSLTEVEPCSHTCTNDCLLWTTENKIAEKQESRQELRKIIFNNEKLPHDWYEIYYDARDKKGLTSQDIENINGRSKTNQTTSTKKAETKSTTTYETESNTKKATKQKYTALGGGLGLDGACMIYNDTGTFDYYNQGECDKLGLKTSGTWQLQYKKEKIQGESKCDGENCFCKITTKDGQNVSAPWIASIPDDVRGNNSCKKSCTYECIWNIEEGGYPEFVSKLFNFSVGNVTNLSKANLNTNGRTAKARSKSNDCDHYSVDSNLKTVHKTDKELCSGTDKNDWQVDFDYGIVYGTSTCSGATFSTPLSPKQTYGSNGKPPYDGAACWCQVNQFTPVDSSSQSVNGRWIFAKEYRADQPNCPNCVYSKGCHKDCARYCAILITTKQDWRKSLFYTSK